MLRESNMYRGRRLDMEIWSILAPEWRERRTDPEVAPVPGQGQGQGRR